jgi:excisionase family DNA binding protein
MGHLGVERGDAVRPSTGQRSGRSRNELQPMLDVKDVAELLGTPERFVRRLIAERRIGYSKVGRYVRFSPADVRAFVDAGRMDPADPWDLLRSSRRAV